MNPGERRFIAKKNRTAFYEQVEGNVVHLEIHQRGFFDYERAFWKLCCEVPLTEDERRCFNEFRESEHYRRNRERYRKIEERLVDEYLKMEEENETRICDDAKCQNVLRFDGERKKADRERLPGDGIGPRREGEDQDGNVVRNPE